MLQPFIIDAAWTLLIAAALAVIGWTVWRPRTALRRGGSWAFPLAAACVFAVMIARFQWPFRDAWHSAGTLAMVIGPVAAGLSLNWRRPAGLAAAARLLPWLLVPAVGVLMWFTIRFPGSIEQTTPWRLTMIGVAVGLAAVIEPIAQARRGWSMPAALAVWCAGAGVFMLFAGFEKFFRVELALAEACAVMAVIAWRVSACSIGRGGSTVIIALTTVMLVLTRAYTYADIPVWCDVVIGVAPLGILLGELPVIRHRPRTRVFIRLLGVMLPIAFGVVAATRHIDLDLYFG
ncbi:MAG: hypothetical protein KC983_04175 [Phycisphaerales bacterium]|nr:hypothetical protein [Phycisphaerales bacterium]